MQTRDFCYWLQGFFEVADPKTLTMEQIEMIKAHLNLVFYHDIDKQYVEGDESQEIHDGKTVKVTPPGPQKFKGQHGLDTLVRC